jgi:hypothetical protein
VAAVGPTVKWSQFRDSLLNLKDAVLDLDPLLIRTLAAFSIDRATTAIYLPLHAFGQHFERPSDVDQCPDKTVCSTPTSICNEIADLTAKSLARSTPPAWPRLPTLDRLAPLGRQDTPGSQGERIEWRNSI